MAGYAMSALQALAGWKGYALASLVSAGVAGTAVGVIQGWRYDAEIALLHAETAQEQAAISTQALDRVAADIEKISAAAARAAGVAPDLTARIGVISKALKNATPLPAGCRPDVVRVRSLQDAVDATNRAAVGSQPR